MRKKRQLKVVLPGNYDEYQINARVPDFILKHENQIENSKIRNRNDFDIDNVTISKNEKDEIEVQIEWTEK